MPYALRNRSPDTCMCYPTRYCRPTDRAMDDGFMTISMYSGGMSGLFRSALQGGQGKPIASLEEWETVRTKEFVLVPEGCAVTVEGVAKVADAAKQAGREPVPANQQSEFTFHPAVEEDKKPLEEHPVPYSFDGTNANSAAIHVKVLPRHLQLIVPSTAN